MKFPSKNKSNKTQKSDTPKPIKVKPAETNKTIKKRALNFIKKMRTSENPDLVDTRQTYADEFKSEFDDSLAFLSKITEQNKTVTNHNTTVKQYPQSVLLNNDSILNQALNQVPGPVYSQEPFPEIDFEPEYIPQKIVIPPRPKYGCLKGGMYPTYRTFTQKTHLSSSPTTAVPNLASASTLAPAYRLTPEQQRQELKQFLKLKSEEKSRVEQVKRQHKIANPRKHQRRKTTRTFRVGKSKYYPQIGVLIPNKTIRTQVLAKKQSILETPIDEIRKYLIKKGLIRVGSSCPHDVLRKMFESSMMMCGEIQNHNPENLLYNYLNNAL
jgi:hypothetical protein